MVFVVVEATAEGLDSELEVAVEFVYSAPLQTVKMPSVN